MVRLRGDVYFLLVSFKAALASFTQKIWQRCRLLSLSLSLSLPANREATTLLVPGTIFSFFTSPGGKIWSLSSSCSLPVDVKKKILFG